MMVVLKTQELAGIDVVSDGELSRFDVNHPETNGMIDYFVGPLAGVRDELHARPTSTAFRARPGEAFARTPAGVVGGTLGEGTLDLPGDYEFVKHADRPAAQVHRHQPLHARQALLDRHYRDRAR